MGETCATCTHFIGSGDWGLCCDLKYDLCYSCTPKCNEYEQLQSELTKKIQNNPYGRTANFKREDGYKEGILAAKSILHNFYKWKGGTEE